MSASQPEAEVRSEAAGTGADVIGLLARRVQGGVAEARFEPDPEMLDRLVPWLERYSRWFSADVHGWENVPSRGPVLLVGNHSGGLLSPDTGALLHAWLERHGTSRPLALLGFDFVFGLPGVSDFFRRLGSVPASMENAEEALGEGAAVLVYPGGDHEVYRPWWRRHEIDFDGRCGFVRLALRTGVPVVPVVANGGHDSIFVVVRGDRLARAMRLDRLRMSIFPFTLQFPLGLAPAWLPHVPLPAKVDIELCEPFDWSELGPEGADDPEVVQACYDEITGRMQETLSRLGREHPLPVLERLARATRLDR